MKKAFTLIELLVVIAIIAILAAILFPVFAQAKAAAKKTAALSNIKQLMTGQLMYASDQDDVFAIGSSYWPADPNQGGWVYDSQPYIKSYGLLIDSSDPKSKARWPQIQVDNPSYGCVPISFAANGLVGWDGSNNVNMGVFKANYGWVGGTSATGTTTTNPADTIAFGSRYNGASISWTGGVFNNIGGDWDKRDAGGVGTLIPDGTRNGQPYVSPDAPTVTFNKDNRWGGVSTYGDQGIFSFVDGHAKTMNPVRTNPDPYNKPESNMWKAVR